MNDVRDELAGSAHITPSDIHFREVADFDLSPVRRIVIRRNLIRIDVNRTIKEVCFEGAGLDDHDFNAERFNFFS